MKYLVALFLFIPAISFAVVDEPAKCLSAKNFPCAVRAGEEETVQLGTWKIHLFKGASIQWENETHLRLLSGKVWVSAAKGSLVFPGLSYSLENSEVIAFIEDQKLFIQNLAGEGRMQSEFVVDFALPVGFENWYGSMTSSGKLEQGVIRPFDVVAVLKDVKSFKKTGSMTAQMETWKKSQAQASEYYQRSVQKQVTDMEAMLKAREERVRQEQAERRELIRMFRERHSLDRRFD